MYHILGHFELYYRVDIGLRGPTTLSYYVEYKSRGHLKNMKNNMLLNAYLLIYIVRKWQHISKPLKYELSLVVTNYFYFRTTSN
jgi:hypothetical protein